METLAAKRAELLVSNIPQLGRMQVRQAEHMLSNSWMVIQLADYSVKKFDSPDSWRLTSTNDDSTEASFRIQRILCAFELPPVSS